MIENTSNSNNYVFGRLSCPFCQMAIELLEDLGVNYIWQDTNNPKIYAEMLAKVKPLIGDKRVTVPQIWIGQCYIGGFDQLQAKHQNGELAQLLS